MTTQIRIEYPTKRKHPFFEGAADSVYRTYVSEASDIIKEALELGDGLPSKVERVNADGEVEQRYEVVVNVWLIPVKQE